MTPAQPEQARSVERRSQLLTAATALLLDSGSHAVTHRRVAQESDSSLGAVRYYFSSREELLAACLQRIEANRDGRAQELLNKLAGRDITHDIAAKWAVEIYYGPDVDDDTVAGTVGCILDCSRESPQMAAQIGGFRQSALVQLEQLLWHCGYENLTASLVGSIIDGRILSATLEREPHAAQLAMDELVTVFKAASGR